MLIRCHCFSYFDICQSLSFLMLFQNCVIQSVNISNNLEISYHSIVRMKSTSRDQTEANLLIAAVKDQQNEYNVYLKIFTIYDFSYLSNTVLKRSVFDRIFVTKK